MTDEQVQGYTYLVCQGVVEATHVMQVKMMYSRQDPDTLATMLDTELANAKEEDFVRYYDKLTDFSDKVFQEALSILVILPLTLQVIVPDFVALTV